MEPSTATPAPSIESALSRARQFSKYLDRLLTASPVLLDSVDLRAPCEVATHVRRPETKVELYRSLRQLRSQTMATLIVRDLAAWASLTEVTQTMTRLAEHTVQAALEWVVRDLAGSAGTPRNADGKPHQLLVVGMGKLGGAELNVSSDIDLVFVYPEDGETDGVRPLSNHEYFSRAGRALIAALSELTEDGFVFRVDMRLRPYGASGPLVVSFDMLENYLVTQGREWERYAWIKARAVTGVQADAPDDAPADTLMALVRPFIYRRHLDYSAFASMRGLHRQIRREVERRDRADNIKLGRGGIREIEFIAQVFQLIRGGHDAALRRQPTLEVLALLAERDLLPHAVVTELSQAYVFLRNLEHRLQYRDDQQTHMIPPDAPAREQVAHSMGYTDFAAMVAALNRQRNAVARQFDALFADTPAEEHPLAALWMHAADAAVATQRLAALGFERPDDLRHRLEQMHGSARYRQMPAVSQSRLDRLAPFAIEAAAAGANRDATLERLLQFLESVSRRESYLALLEEYPQARKRLAELMRASPWVAQYLTQHPILLDELLDARTLHAPPDWRALAHGLRATLDSASDDTEKQMDTLRHFKHAQTLRLIAQDLSGALPLEKLSDHLSDLACTVLAETLRCAWLGMGRCRRAAPAFAVIGYGKLGGKELGYASDLDLVFLYEDADDDEAPANYARLAQRINTWLSSTTAAGQLYDTDLRLRPDGVSGLMVSSFTGFRHYQQQQAWVWEHQALTRARYAAGDTTIGAAFETLRCGVLRRARDRASLRKDVTEMREKMHAAHPNRSGLFDVKHDRGGIVDVEFIVQYLVLGYASQHAALTGNIGNLALLQLAAQIGLISAAGAEAAQQAYRAYRKIQHGLRLQGERYARVATATTAANAAAVCDLWQSVFGNAR